MRKLFLFIGLFVSACLFAQADSTLIAQNPALKELAHTTYDALVGAMQQVFLIINLNFLLVLLACATFCNEAIETESFASFLTGLAKVPRGLRTFIIGVLLMILFCWAYSVRNKLEIFSYIITIFTAMILMSIGLNKIIRFISEKVGLKFSK